MGSIDEPVRGPKAVVCISCGLTLKPFPKMFKCPRCGGLLDPVYEEPLEPLRGRGVWRYSGLLPKPRGAVITMGEGSTPLVELPHASEVTGARVYAKLESSNPTGSFKDRGMTVAVSLAKASGAKAVIAASTGNTAASAAAYSSRARLETILVLPRGGVAAGKTLQAQAYGASIVQVDGGFDDAIKVVREVSEDPRIYPLNSFNPYRLEGQKTIAFEVLEDLSTEPDYVIVPVGNAGNIAAIWKGFKEASLLGLPSKKRPKMIGVQAQGASPIADAWARGLREITPVVKPKTVASAIRIGNPVNWPKALMAVEESKGAFIKVSDGEIMSAMRVLAVEEGLLVEPASAASYAGLLKASRLGLIEKGGIAVLILTGHGLKDPQAIEFIGRISSKTYNPDTAESAKSLIYRIIENI